MQICILSRKGSVTAADVHHLGLVGGPDPIFDSVSLV